MWFGKTAFTASAPFPPIQVQINYLVQQWQMYLPLANAAELFFIIFYPRIAVELCIVWPEQSYLAAVVSSSISGHVCGGVVRRWLSRNTEALKANGEIFPLYF